MSNDVHASSKGPPTTSLAAKDLKGAWEREKSKSNGVPLTSHRTRTGRRAAICRLMDSISVIRAKWLRFVRAHRIRDHRHCHLRPPINWLALEYGLSEPGALDIRRQKAAHRPEASFSPR